MLLPLPTNALDEMLLTEPGLELGATVNVAALLVANPAEFVATTV
jgi:hypothetical protein